MSWAAKQQTHKVLKATADAAEALQYFDGRVINGHGELADPSNAAWHLHAAARALGEALNALARANEAGWTTSD